MESKKLNESSFDLYHSLTSPHKFSKWDWIIIVCWAIFSMALVLQDPNVQVALGKFSNGSLYLISIFTIAISFIGSIPMIIGKSRMIHRYNRNKKEKVDEEVSEDS